MNMVVEKKKRGNNLFSSIWCYYRVRPIENKADPGPGTKCGSGSELQRVCRSDTFANSSFHLEREITIGLSDKGSTTKIENFFFKKSNLAVPLPV